MREEPPDHFYYQKWLKMEEIQHTRFALGLLGDKDVFPHVLNLLEDAASMDMCEKWLLEFWKN